MKRYWFIFLLASVSLALTSCFNSEAQSTPEMYASQMYRLHGGQQDTLRATDLLSVGDTLRMPVIVSGQYNYLRSFVIQAPTGSFDYWLTCDSTVRAALAGTSKLEEGVMYFKPASAVLVTVNLWFVPRLTGSQRMTFAITNDATNEAYSHREFYIDFAVH